LSDSSSNWAATEILQYGQ